MIIINSARCFKENESTYLKGKKNIYKLAYILHRTSLGEASENYVNYWRCDPPPLYPLVKASNTGIIASR